MLRNIAGPHAQAFQGAPEGEAARRLLTTSKLGSLKILEDCMSELYILRECAANNPGIKVCGRLTVSGDGTLQDVLVDTDRAIELYRPLGTIFGHANVYIEVPINEKYQNGEQLSQLNDATMPCVKRIWENGFNPIAFNFSVQNPFNLADLDRIAEVVAYLDAHDGAVDYHNYTIPTALFTEQNDLRYRAMRRRFPNTRFWLGEGFVDHGLVDGVLGGWQSFGMSAADAGRLCRKMAQEYSKDQYVIGWSVYGIGCKPDWYARGFEVGNVPEITAVFSEQYEIGDGMFNLGDGLKRMIPLLGQPLESEVYHFPGTPMEVSMAVYENGRATWSKLTNCTIGERYSDKHVFSDKGNDGDGQGTIYQIYPDGA